MPPPARAPRARRLVADRLSGEGGLRSPASLSDAHGRRLRAAEARVSRARSGCWRARPLPWSAGGRAALLAPLLARRRPRLFARWSGVVSVLGSSAAGARQPCAVQVRPLVHSYSCREKHAGNKRRAARSRVAGEGSAVAALFAQSAEAGGPMADCPSGGDDAPRPADFIRDRPARDVRAVRGPLPIFRLSVVGGVGNARRWNPELQPQGLPAALRQRKNEEDDEVLYVR